MPKYRSFSQLGDYQKCPYAYYLKRIEKVWSAPAAWLPMGTAVHHALEMYELAERDTTVEAVKDIYARSYIAEVNRYLEDTPNTDYWQSSGPYKGQEDIDRRLIVGKEHVERYIRWADLNPTIRPYEFPDGKLAIELPFMLDLGGVQVKGFIDQVMTVDGGMPFIRDLKSGSANPSGPMQLKVYQEAMVTEGMDVQLGDYFMTKSGKPWPKVPYDLASVSRIELADVFGQLDENILAEKYVPTPGPACARCDVKRSCAFSI